MDVDGTPKIQSVLMTTDAVGGVWTYALTLAKALRSRDISVYLATMGPRPSAGQRCDAKALDNVLLFESDFRLEWMEDPWEDVHRAGAWLLELERNLDPGVIHLNGYVHAALKWRNPVLCVGHSCVLSWWRAVKGEDVSESWDRYRAQVQRGIAAAAMVVAPSHAMLAELKRWYGSPRVCRVVSNGCDTAAFSPGAKEPMIFSAGRLWDEAKNIARLDEIAGEISWPVYVAGDGSIGNGVRHLGRLNPRQMRDWYSRASIYALPARYEPFGLSVLEAALSECALVLGDIPSLRENWDGAATFVSPGDPGSLRRALNRLIADDDTRFELARRARERAIEFTPERMADGYIRAYGRISQNQRVKTCA